MRGVYFKIDQSLNSTDLEGSFVVYNGTGKSYHELSLSELVEENQNGRIGRIRGIDWVFVVLKPGKNQDSFITFR